jgi:hypothetical protein
MTSITRGHLFEIKLRRWSVLSHKLVRIDAVLISHHVQQSYLLESLMMAPKVMKTDTKAEFD